MTPLEAKISASITSAFPIVTPSFSRESVSYNFALFFSNAFSHYLLRATTASTLPPATTGTAPEASPRL